jgi:hypothetical protein
MARALESRLSALESEAGAAAQSLIVLFLEAGESEAEALIREGYAPGSNDVMCVSFVSPEAKPVLKKQGYP